MRSFRSAKQDLQKIVAALQEGSQTQTELVSRFTPERGPFGTLLEHQRG